MTDGCLGLEGECGVEISGMGCEEWIDYFPRAPQEQDLCAILSKVAC